MSIAPATVRDSFASAGRLRAAINLGNPILAGTDPATGRPKGVSIDLANELARRLDVPVELMRFDAAGKSVDAVTQEAADIGFCGRPVARRRDLLYRSYVLIEGSYLVELASPLRSNDDVDRPGQRVVVGKGSAYDLHLSRELKHAQILRAPTSPTVVATFLEQRAEVAAGVRQQLEADAAQHPGLRLLPGRFMVIQQAMGLPRSRDPQAAAYLAAFVEEMKASGFVADALARHGVQGASVAPAA